MSADAVLEAQQRLRAIGHGPIEDAPGELGPGTRAALQAFQRQRGLDLTGEPDTDTLARLEEATHTLGSRLLFLSRPMLRGDDVADLQEALALLGFDPGRVDGIFGPMTERALRDFQANCAITASGVMDRRSLERLSQLSAHGASRHTVIEARERAGLSPRSARRLVVLVGDDPLIDQLAELLAESVLVVVAGERTTTESAALANEERAGLTLAVERSNDPGVLFSYFATDRSKSLLGERVASEAARVLRASTSLPVSVRGRSVPILRETTMPAVLICVCDPSEDSAVHIAHAVAHAALGVFDSIR